MDNYQNTIQLLIDGGHIILQVIFDSNTEYFLVYEWRTAEENSSSYHQMVGINITNFLNNNSGKRDKNELISRLQEYIKYSEVMRVEFSKKAAWYKWSSYNGMSRKW
jgi:hypothetical protein